MNYADRIIVALDTDSLKEAEGWLKVFGARMKHFKIGSPLFTACGRRAIEMVKKRGGDVFLDLKFHDIPSTVAKAVTSAQKLGVWMLNVHASGGKKMMEAARRAVEDTDPDDRPMVVAVTVLTSMSESDLSSTGINRSLKDQVKHFAALADESGLDGVVASAEEVEIIKQHVGKDFLVVTPGVRPAWADSDDQSRIVTPKKAFELGADYVVIGRPLTQAKDPQAACERLLQELFVQ
ncbi:MAG: orotidine-5'-phosphate decarboxylase [Candidatus Omnitrophica bacterium]|nr:orotidine-5'-phosphate decarboxylase [Candidatus Omnitrophota bacterium]